jgi:hypothetical protein
MARLNVSAMSGEIAVVGNAVTITVEDGIHSKTRREEEAP